MMLSLPHFGNDIRVDEVARQSSTVGFRDCTFPRLGRGSVNLGPSPRSTSFHVGCPSLFSLCHSSIEMITAVSTPRRVTTCGPFSSVSSINSLNRDLASCSCHLVIHSPKPDVTSSQMTSQEKVQHLGLGAAFLLDNDFRATI